MLVPPLRPVTLRTSSHPYEYFSSTILVAVRTFAYKVSWSLQQTLSAPVPAEVVRLLSYLPEVQSFFVAFSSNLQKSDCHCLAAHASNMYGDTKTCFFLSSSFQLIYYSLKSTDRYSATVYLMSINRSLCLSEP